MEHLIWLVIFIILALLATVPVHFHLAAIRKVETGGTQTSLPRTVKTRPCPRCEHQTPADAAFCEKCGVPMLLWKLKAAREVDSTQESREIPIIDQDVCIGCSACVNACEDDVLGIVAGKSAVTNLDACTSAGTCAAVCPTGACQLGGGGAARRVEVPQIGDDFQTNQAGIYAVGELGGLGLIKNAITEGQLVVERILQSHSKTEGLLDFVIIGSGPAGLSAGLAAKEAGLDAVLLEQGSFANTIRRFPNRKIVMAEPIKIPLYGSLWISDAPKETLLGVWQTIVDSAGLKINEHETALQVTHTDHDTLMVKTTKASYECAKVILAIGKRGTPNQLKVSGAELPKVFYNLTDTAQYNKCRVLVVGGGDSAAEAAIGLSKQPGNQVSLSYRKPAFTRLREKNLEALEKAANQGDVELYLGSQVREITEKEVALELDDGSACRLDNDFVFAFLGGSSPNAFLEKIGVTVVIKELSMDGVESEKAVS